MGAIAALFSERGDACALLLSMLRAMGRRGGKLWLSDGNRVMQNLEKVEPVEARTCIGAVYEKRPVLEAGNGFAFALDGRFYPPREVDGVRAALHASFEDLGRLLLGWDGAYAFAALKEDLIMVGRDPLGLKPLYYGSSRDLWALSSEKKALWALGLEAEPFPPGYVLTVGPEGARWDAVRPLRRVPTRPMGVEEAVSLLSNCLEEAVVERVQGLHACALGFSGGLDSGLLASLAASCGVDLQLISVGLEGSRELEWVGEAAKLLGLKLHRCVYQPRHVEECLPEVLWAIEADDPLKASIAIPIYWTACEAKSLGLDWLLAGQGADELFAGYHRHLRVYREHGAEALVRVLFEDVAESPEENFARDEKVCASAGVELLLPYMDWSLVQLALSIPPELKIRGGVRKWILRQTAKRLGLPSEIADREKKAVQYVTGVYGVLRRLAKARGLKLREYLHQVFVEVSEAGGP